MHPKKEVQVGFQETSITYIGTNKLDVDVEPVVVGSRRGDNDLLDGGQGLEAVLDVGRVKVVVHYCRPLCPVASLISKLIGAAEGSRRSSVARDREGKGGRCDKSRVDDGQ